MDRPIQRNLGPLLILIFCLLMTAFSRGMGESYGVFLIPLSEHFSWNRGQATSVYSIYMLSLGLGSLIAGLTFDKFGPRFNYMIGTALLTICYYSASSFESLWQFYIFLGIFGGIGASMVGVIPSQSLVSRWFNYRLGTALSIAYAGQGLGSLIIAPTAQFLIVLAGWGSAYKYASVGFLSCFLLVSILPWKRISEGAIGNPRRTVDGKAYGGLSLKEATKTKVFWAFFFIFGTTAFAIFGISLQVVAYLLEQGFSSVEAAFIFGLIGMLAFVGMALTGLAADRWPRHQVATVSYTLTLVGISALALIQVYPNWLTVTIFIGGFGLSAGARGPIITTLMAEIFAGQGLASIYGASNLGQGLGAAIGAYSSGVLYDFFGNYNTGFAVYSIFGLVGASLFWSIPEIRMAKINSRNKP